jgi:hypothetical protein
VFLRSLALRRKPNDRHPAQNGDQDFLGSICFGLRGSASRRAAEEGTIGGRGSLPFGVRFCESAGTARWWQDSFQKPCLNCLLRISFGA